MPKAIAENADRFIRTQLAPNEELLWGGLPRQGFYLQPFDLVSLILCVPLFGVGLYFLGPPVLLVALPLGLRVLYLQQLRERGYYAVTNQRIIIVRNWGERKMIAFKVQDIGDIELINESNGGGTISFAGGTSLTGWYDPGAAPLLGRFTRSRYRYRFELDHGADKVYEIIKTAKSRTETWKS